MTHYELLTTEEGNVAFSVCEGLRIAHWIHVRGRRLEIECCYDDWNRVAKRLFRRLRP